MWVGDEKRRPFIIPPQIFLLWFMWRGGERELWTGVRKRGQEPGNKKESLMCFI